MVPSETARLARGVREPTLRERIEANSAGARARRYGEPREHVAQYAAKYGDELAAYWLDGWDAEDRARTAPRGRQDESGT